ncbi:exported hypothetical protein [Candidatus Sulfotelmatomonas gaucii]|uniref:Secreted protein n=1 Tax=Candidatus Sulfuritelmatomonas gaucii TaxID=2043161 RepID=A0A2N9LK09_9BACT|nr:exported hypothetical protein [Candidatus Sulfotelmatomonas gaucii]
MLALADSVGAAGASGSALACVVATDADGSGSALACVVATDADGAGFAAGVCTLLALALVACCAGACGVAAGAPCATACPTSIPASIPTKAQRPILLSCAPISSRCFIVSSSAVWLEVGRQLNLKKSC